MNNKTFKVSICHISQSTQLPGRIVWVNTGIFDVLNRNLNSEQVFLPYVKKNFPRKGDKGF